MAVPLEGNAKMPARSDTTITSCPMDWTVSRPSNTCPSASWTKAAPLISSVERGYNPSALELYVPGGTLLATRIRIFRR
eukprot:714440-Prymnesium_polylepis.1